MLMLAVSTLYIFFIEYNYTEYTLYSNKERSAMKVKHEIY